jgi:hypothetical protein
MDTVDPDKCAGAKPRDDEVFCPNCAERAHPYIDVLDTSRGQTYRLYKCRCGQIVWQA